jgi:quercetin dioxygenase-like cupin family protein
MGNAVQERSNIMALEDAMKQLEGYDPEGKETCRITHHFAPGVYARAMFMPAGALVTGKIHLTEHLSIMARGKMSVYNGGESVDFVAGDIILSKPGSKRAGYAHEDSVWITIHATDMTDPEKIEDEIIVETFEEFDMMLEHEEIKRIL